MDQGSGSFSLKGELPAPGVTLLEASAGTGKTYAIAGLVTRFVAEGTSIEDFLIITFTVAATGELRKRIRDRLVSSVEKIDSHVAGDSKDETGSNDDDVLAALLDGTAEQIRIRRAYLSAAVSDFDSATITTTHGFCDAALSELGLAGDAELRPEFQTDLSELAQEAAADLYAKRFGQGQDIDLLAPITVAAAQAVVSAATDQWDAEIVPPAMGLPDDVATVRSVLAQDARRLINHRKRVSGKMSFSDQIGRLKAAVQDQQRGPLARELLAKRYPIVLVDEFQDTDTSQWDVLRDAFGGGGCRLLLIGDPKQAIYAFRGADIYAYLAAVNQADSRWSLTRNYRTDDGLVRALNAVFGSLQLGDPSIQYRQVTSAVNPDQQKNRSIPLRIRMTTDQTQVKRTSRGAVEKNAGIELISRDVAADIVTALTDKRAVPREIAVLVGRNRDADQVRDALTACGVPAVVRGSRSVFATQAADDVKRLLLALDRPSSTPTLHRLAISSLIGWSTARLASATDQELGGLSRRVTDWAHDLEHDGIAGVFASIKSRYGLLTRLLAQQDGERALTDLDQVVELVHEYETSTRASAAALASWLTQRIDEATTSTDSDERSRRLESDAEAVQVITIHAAKGLEFDLVYCPFLWTAPVVPKNQETFYYHRGGGRELFVGGSRSEGFRDAKRDSMAEAQGEGLRQAYVAMTRARHELVVWWADGYDSHLSPLAGVVSHIYADGPADRLRLLAEQNPTIDVTIVDRQPEQTSWKPSADSANLARDRGLNEGPRVNSFQRTIDGGWGRTSFSGLTAVAHGGAGGFRVAEPDVSAVEDESDMEVSLPYSELGRFQMHESDEVLRTRRSLLADIAGGATFGSFVHSIFENVDFAADQLSVEVADETTAAMRRWAITLEQPTALVAGLVAAIQTPLGQDLANISLADVTRQDRLDEMDFEYPLAGGNTPTGEFNTAAVRELLDRELSADDRLRGYLPFLANPDLDRDVHGFLSGSIDLVLRTRGGTSEPRFSVIDYKTNRLGGVDLSAWDYRPEAVEQAVFSANYPLQFLLYNVALHRMLSVRLPGYDPEVNLGPVKYLFVRGMFGSDNPAYRGQPCGIYSWQPTARIVVALSELIRTGESL